MSMIRFQPWCGEHYHKGYRGKRLLVMGESHYDDGPDETHADPQKTIKVICDQFTAPNYFRYPFLTRIAKTFLGSDIDLDIAAKAKFWNDVAFYNYVQFVVGHEPGIRPTAAMFADSENAFQEVLARLRPEVIITFGYSVWDNMSTRGREGPRLPIGTNNRNGRTWICPYPDGEALLYAVPHASNRRYSSIEHAPFVHAGLELSNGVAK